MVDALRSLSAWTDGTARLSTPRRSSHVFAGRRIFMAVRIPSSSRAVPDSVKRVTRMGLRMGPPRTRPDPERRRGLRLTHRSDRRSPSAEARHRGDPVDLAACPAALADRRFECFVFPDLLHLVPEPTRVVRTLLPLLAHGGSVVVSVPNLTDLNSRRRWLVGRVQRKNPPVVVNAHFGYRLLDRYDRVGTHRTSIKMVRNWLSDAGLSVAEVRLSVPARRRRYQRRAPAFAESLLADRIIVRATP